MLVVRLEYIRTVVTVQRRSVLFDDMTRGSRASSFIITTSSSASLRILSSLRNHLCPHPRLHPYPAVCGVCRVRSNRSTFIDAFKTQHIALRLLRGLREDAGRRIYSRWVVLLPFMKKYNKLRSPRDFGISIERFRRFDTRFTHHVWTLDAMSLGLRISPNLYFSWPCLQLHSRNRGVENEGLVLSLKRDTTRYDGEYNTRRKADIAGQIEREK